jgi:serine/threonine protein kinase
MPVDRDDLALSRTFKLVDASLALTDDSSACSDNHNSFQWQLLELRDETDTLGLARTAGMGGKHIIDGKYRLLSLLGEGGMGSVYRVRHLFLNKEMAFKTFRKATLSPLAWRRFQREAKAIGKLTHSNIVQVFDFGICEGNVPYYTMELLSGRSLAEKLKTDGRMSLEAALPVFISIASALSHAHNLGIVHRDIKPDNIFLDQASNGKVVAKVVDFGLAKLATSQGVEGQMETSGGLIFGSPFYMSPEQSTGKTTDSRSDIYSFGCTFFEVLTGRPPFAGQSAFDTIQMHLQDASPLLVDVNPALGFNQMLEDIMKKLLAKDLVRRYQSFEEVLADLALLRRKDQDDRNGKFVAAMETLATDATDTSLAARGFDNCQEVTADLSRRLWPLELVGSGLLSVAALIVAILISVFAAKMQARTSPTPVKLDCLQASVGEPKGNNHFFSDGGSGPRKFTFPTGERIGYLSWAGGKQRRAEGVVVVPKGTLVVLEASDEVWRKPELLARFRPDDLYSITCRDYSACNYRTLDSITRHLSQLQGLELTGGNIGNESIPLLNRLKNLRELVIADTNITGGGLAQLDRLPQLVFLDATQIKEISATLRALRGSHAMSKLILDDCTVTDADLQNIGTMPSLSFLSLNHLPLKNTDFRCLSALSSLGGLSVSCTGLGPESISTLHQLKKLNWLHIRLSDWSDADKLRLKQALPADCTIFEDQLNPALKVWLKEK